LYAGLESLKWGHGGDRKIAEFLGLVMNVNYNTRLTTNKIPGIKN
jgi:hypothetical protein